MMTQAQTSPQQPGAVFASEFATEHNTPPFSLIGNADYEPAISAGIEKARKELADIASNPEAPTFDNTIVALDRAGRDLDRVLNVFFNLLSADTDDEMMEISLRVTPLLADYSSSIVLDQGLWKRVKAVYDRRSSLNLTPEQKTLLQKTYDSFALSGADLQGADRETFRRLSSELSELATRFGQNVLKGLNTYEIWLSKDDLAGLPEGIVAEAAELAQAKGREGEYLFTLAQPTYMAFMKYSERPDLREKFYRLNTGRNTKGEFSNIEVMKRIAAVRLEIANLLGSPNSAVQTLKTTMAGTPEKVYELLDQLRDAYRPALDREMTELRDFASELEGKPIDINAWDYSYYSNKLRQARYAYDEEELEGGDMRTVLHFHPAIAPVKICVLPLSKKLGEGAEKIYAQLSKKFNCEYDDRGNIGKRYRRQDEIGTPFCVTYDFDSQQDHAVTVRFRDSMEQERVAIADLDAYFSDKFDF